MKKHNEIFALSICCLQKMSFCFSLEKVLVSSLRVLCSNIWPTVAVTHGGVCYSQFSSCDISVYLL